jgi:hypothetical protein
MTGKKRNADRDMVGKPKRSMPLRRGGRIILKGISGWGHVDLIDLA